MNVTKGILYLLITLSSFVPLYGQRERTLEHYKNHAFHELSREQVKEYEYLQQKKKHNNNLQNLTLAKNSLINGELEKAHIFLERIPKHLKSIQKVVSHYRALIAFIEEDYPKSLKALQNITADNVSNYKEVCLLKLINYTALGMKEAYKKESSFCEYLLEASSVRGKFWFQQYKLLSSNEEKIFSSKYLETIRDINYDPTYTGMWLKLALFLGKDEDIIKLLPQMPLEAYESATNRELIALAYYRLGNTAMAEEFISDIDTANADNIRGNISLTKGKPELAFGHYQLALKKKENSINALKRSLPLAWQLKQWDKTIDLLGKVPLKHIDEKKKLALKAAAYMRSNKSYRAAKTLNLLEHQYKGLPPLEIDLMKSYNSLTTHHVNDLEKYSGRSCKKYDGLNCYIQLKTLTNSTLGQLITSNKEVFTEEFDVDSLRKKVKATPMKEAIIIDQKDIEELDSLEYKP